MNEKFTISESANDLLAIMRDFDRVSNRLYAYFQDITEDEQSKDDEANRLFKPFNQSVIDIKEKLLGLFQLRIERALEEDRTDI